MKLLTKHDVKKEKNEEHFKTRRPSTNNADIHDITVCRALFESFELEIVFKDHKSFSLKAISSFHFLL